MPFQYNMEKRGSVTVISLIGELRIFDLAEYTAFFDEQIANGNSNIIINLESINYLDSTAIGLLVNIKRNCEDNGGRLVLSTVKPEILKVLSITGIDQFLPIFSTLDESLAVFKGE